MSSGLTHWSNSSGVTTLSATAASFNVVPSLWAFFAVAAALSYPICMYRKSQYLISHVSKYVMLSEFNPWQLNTCHKEKLMHPEERYVHLLQHSSQLPRAFHLLRISCDWILAPLYLKRAKRWSSTLWLPLSSLISAMLTNIQPKMKGLNQFRSNCVATFCSEWKATFKIIP